MSDERIKKDVVDRLYWDNRVDVSDVRVVVSDGEVTLSGAVPSYSARRASFVEALQVEGVRSVNSEVDKTVADWVVSALDRNPHVDVDSIHVSVDEGVPPASWGPVPNWAGYIAAEEDVKRTVGVTDVHNELVVD